MKFTLMHKDTEVSAEQNPKIIERVLEVYPELSMMKVMEELNELSIAASKGVRNGNAKKVDNIAEEIIDVLEGIQWLIMRFNISDEQLYKWYKEKYDRTTKRAVEDAVIFRNKEARDKYAAKISSTTEPPVLKSSAKMSPGEVTIQCVAPGKYSVTGDLERLPEFSEMILNHLRSIGEAPQESHADDLKKLANRAYDGECIPKDKLVEKFIKERKKEKDKKKKKK